MSGVAFQIIAPLPPPQLLQRPVDRMRLPEMRTRVELAIADIDRALSRPRFGRIRRSSAPAVDQRPVRVPFEYHAAGRVVGVR